MAYTHYARCSLRHRHVLYRVPFFSYVRKLSARLLTTTARRRSKQERRRDLARLVLTTSDENRSQAGNFVIRKDLQRYSDIISYVIFEDL